MFSVESVSLQTGTFRTVVNNYAKIRVLILDEWLLYPLSEEESRDLLEIAERRYHTTTTILCSQFTVFGWFDKIPKGGGSYSLSKSPKGDEQRAG